MAETLEAAKLLDVDVDELARMLALVATDRLGRLERLETVEAEPPEDPADRGRRDAGASAAICLPVQRWRRRASIRATTAAGVGRCSRRGREERSLRPSRPCTAKRASHLRTVRGQTPAARAAAFGVCPLRTSCTTRSRPSGVRRAFWWMFIRSSGESLKRRNSSFPAQDRMNNLLKAHS